MKKKLIGSYLFFLALFSGCYTSVDTLESFGKASKTLTIEDAGNKVLFSHDGKYVLTKVNDRHEMYGSTKAADAILWNATTGAFIRTFDLDRRQFLQAACFSPDGSKVAAAGIHEMRADIRTMHYPSGKLLPAGY